jgi:hypothetical protein
MAFRFHRIKFSDTLQGKYEIVVLIRSIFTILCGSCATIASQLKFQKFRKGTLVRFCVLAL